MNTIPDTIKLGTQLMNSGQFDQAEDLFHQMLQTHENHSDALHFMGLISHRNGKSKDAIDFISKAIDNNPHIAVYHYNLGYIFTALGQLEKAIKAYKNSISLKPNYTEAINNLGLILFDQDYVDNFL